MSEIKHQYGKNIHILSDPYLQTLLAQLCSEETIQPTVSHLITSIYSSLIQTVANDQFPTRPANRATRMAKFHPKESVIIEPIIDPETSVISVNLARAGTIPSHVCYSSLNYFLNPKRVRQDHISIARVTNAQDQVVGSNAGSVKIGGNVDGAIILFPDPMGATGNTIVESISLYKKLGRPKKFIAIHCIVTPEYLKLIQSKCPELEVFAVRLDRGLSPTSVLKEEPGLFWDQERGLNDKHYIVPGGGGLGEILNNAEL